MARKFIINDNELIIGNVEYHFELLKGRDKDKTIGGGYWYYDKPNNQLYFYGCSHDFGGVTEEQFNLSEKRLPLSLKNAIFNFSENESLTINNVLVDLILKKMC